MRAWLITIALLGGCADPECVDDSTFFRETLWPDVVGQTCISCHTSEGAARESGLILQPSHIPGAMAANEAAMAELATLQKGGESWLLLKPQGLEGHGGGPVIPARGDEMKLLREFVSRVESPTVCADDGSALGAAEGLVLASPVSTLRKASLMLVGTLPERDQVGRVRSGGRAALIQELWQMMATETFADRMIELLNDRFHTDRYLISRDGIGIFDDDLFPGVYWYEGTSASNTNRTLTSHAIAREPLMLAHHVLREDKPWTEILTADYTMANPYLKMAYGLPVDGVPAWNDPASEVWEPVEVPGVPHAGMLTTAAFMNRYPTTDTNRNRHRAWFFYKTFLGTDILTFAERPIDSTNTETHNPTMNDAQCNVCHATMDPMAGLFQNWDDEGRYRPPEEGWHDDMRPPGFGEEDLPGGARPDALQWLAARAVADERFDLATVKMMTELLTGQTLLTPQTALDDVAIKALSAQDAWIGEVAAEFRERGHDMKWLVETIVLSHWFRAIAADGASEATLLQAGTAKLLTPEELHRKIIATTGLPWRRRAGDPDRLLSDYRLMYGGIDSFSITERLTEPTAVMHAVATAMATEMSCEAIPYDFILPAEQRRLFPYVEADWVPLTEDGFDIPEVQTEIRKNLQWMFLHLLGEDVPVDDPEIDAAYTLFMDTWLEGREKVRSEQLDDELPYRCQTNSDWWTGVDLPDSMRLRRDDDYLVRAWMAVTTYLLTDYRFLHE